MPHSHNPFARYRPSTVPPLNLSNSQRLYSLRVNGKLYGTTEYGGGYSYCGEGEGCGG